MTLRFGGGRYEVRAFVGEGAQGRVWRAHDVERGDDVALKALLRREPDDLLRLKNEFRMLSDLRHPNLIRLYDLVVDEREAFFTMELLDGVDFVTHARGPERVGAPGPLDAAGVARLRAALAQLLEGLQSLHAAGRLHRDVKPSNVLVTPEGRLVLLDFGLSSERRLAPFEGAGIVGTIAYMAPELVWGEPMSPAADWHSVGVMLFEALTGQLPFDGHGLDVLLRKRHQPPPSVRDLCPDTPADLDRLAIALMQPVATERPDAHEVRRLLGLAAETLPPLPTPSVSSVYEAPFFGRDEEQRRLSAALDGPLPLTLHVHGVSGIGKSSMLLQFLDRLEDAGGCVVLRGRCYPQEAVPFKALDSLLDLLSRFLCGLRRTLVESLLPERTGALLRVFPVLGRVDAVCRRDEGAGAEPEPHETRRQAFAALRDLLGGIARWRRLVLWIDDLQWGDLDSAFLLHTLMHGPDAPPLLLLLSYRSEDRAESPVLAALPAPDRTLELGPLSLEALRALALAVLGAEADATRAEAIARESAGSPFLACELARHFAARRATAGIATVVDERVRGLDPPARRLLEVVAVAGGPCGRRVAARAAGLGTALPDAFSTLRHACLLRHSDAGDDVRLETYHDRIREAVVAALEPSALRERHLALARALEAASGADPLALVQHYIGGGDAPRARAAAVRAAERAYGALAFDQAARLFGLALDLAPGADERPRLLRGRAEALRQGGRGGEAGAAYAEAAASLARQAGSFVGAGGDILALQRLASEQYLRSGHLEQGLDMLRLVLDRVGEPFPATPGRALGALVVHRLRLAVRGLGHRPREESEVPPALLARLDACWTAAVGLVWVDPIRSADFHGRHTRMALDAGEPTRVVRALCTEAAFHAATGGDKARQRARRALALARRLGAGLGDPLSEGLTAVCAAGYHYFSGEFADGFRHSELAAEVLRTRCTGVAWELTNAHIFGMWSLAHRADVQALAARVPAILAESAERGDRLATVSLAAGIPTALRLLAADRPDEALRTAEDALAQWPAIGFQLPHYYGLVSAVLASLYRGDAEGAWRRLEGGWPALRAARLLDFQLVRCELTLLRARCALRRRDRAEAARCTRRLAGEDAAWVKPWVAVLEAGLAAAAGDGRATATRLETAAARFDAAGMPVLAEAARVRRGDGAAALRARGVADPAAFAAMLMPLP